MQVTLCHFVPKLGHMSEVSDAYKIFYDKVTLCESFTSLLYQKSSLTCREVQGVVLWVYRGSGREDEMCTEARIQFLRGYMTLVITQHHLAGGGPRTEASWKP